MQGGETGARGDTGAAVVLALAFLPAASEAEETRDPKRKSLFQDFFPGLPGHPLALLWPSDKAKSILDLTRVRP